MISVQDIEKNDMIDPFAIFNSWFEAATSLEVNDANAMSLATVDKNGMPNVRIVLLKGIEHQNFIFYTNKNSAKGQELLGTPKAAVCFHWKSIRRQIRVRGDISSVSDATADEYYNSRPIGSRIGAWASQQSERLESREVLEAATKTYADKFADGNVPRPQYWSGYFLKPSSIEFWQDGSDRLHDRIVFEIKSDSEDEWERMRLYP